MRDETTTSEMRLEALHASEIEPSKALGQVGHLARSFAAAKDGYFYGDDPAEWRTWLRGVRAAAAALRDKLFIDDVETCTLMESLEHAVCASDLVLHSYSAADGEASPGERLLADEIERLGGPLWPRTEN